jgi:hypothetical protein
MGSSTMDGTNPFGGLNSLTPATTNPPTTNPLANFSFGGASTTVGSGFIFGSSSAPSSAKQTTSVAAPTGGGFSIASTTVPSTKIIAPTNIFSGSSPIDAMKTDKDNKNGGESEYKKKMRKLNQSFLSWMDKQSLDHPLSFWKEGVKV